MTVLFERKEAGARREGTLDAVMGPALSELKGKVAVSREVMMNEVHRESHSQPKLAWCNWSATGRNVISAARDAAYEGYQGHGVLTYALLEALDIKAARRLLSESEVPVDEPKRRQHEGEFASRHRPRCIASQRNMSS